jgi:hypothetical protein
LVSWEAVSLGANGALLPAGTAPSLRALLPQLVATVTGSHNASSMRQYFYHWRKFRRFCIDSNVPFLPAAPLTVALYLVSLMDPLAAAPYSRGRRGRPVGLRPSRRPAAASVLSHGGRRETSP